MLAICSNVASCTIPKSASDPCLALASSSSVHYKRLSICIRYCNGEIAREQRTSPFGIDATVEGEEEGAVEVDNWAVFECIIVEPLDELKPSVSIRTASY